MIREYAREMGHELKPDFEVAIYHNVNVDEDRDRALAEAKRFLDSYYSVGYRQDMLKLWVAAGSPAQCVQSLQRYVEAGATTILLRVAGYDQKRQFKRVTEEILPAFRSASRRRRAAGPPVATVEWLLLVRSRNPCRDARQRATSTLLFWCSSAPNGSMSDHLGALWAPPLRNQRFARLSAGGEWIRTSGSAMRSHRQRRGPGRAA